MSRRPLPPSQRTIRSGPVAASPLEQSPPVRQAPDRDSLASSGGSQDEEIKESTNEIGNENQETESSSELEIKSQSFDPHMLIPVASHLSPILDSIKAISLERPKSIVDSRLATDDQAGPSLDLGIEFIHLVMLPRNEKERAMNEDNESPSGDPTDDLMKSLQDFHKNNISSIPSPPRVADWDKPIPIVQADFADRIDGSLYKISLLRPHTIARIQSLQLTVGQQIWLEDSDDELHVLATLKECPGKQGGELQMYAEPHWARCRSKVVRGARGSTREVHE